MTSRSATPLNPVTEADCVLFDGYVQKWQALLSLEQWRIERSSRRAKKVMAEVVVNDTGMLATYRIGLTFGSAPVTPLTLESTALHEVLHVMLRKFKLDQSEANEHEIVNMLEKLLMKAKFT
jgi:hypothetical protein